MSSEIYSQQLIKTAKGDTLLALSMEQGKYLLKQIYTLREVKDLFKVSEIERLNCDTIIKLDEIRINDYKKVMANQSIVISLKEAEVQTVKLELKSVNKALKWQKTYKWCGIIGGCILSSYLGYKYITK